MYYEDAKAYMENYDGKFDVVIMDICDPIEVPLRTPICLCMQPSYYDDNLYILCESFAMIITYCNNY